MLADKQTVDTTVVTTDPGITTNPDPAPASVFVNANGADLILPDGTTIAPGHEAALTQQQLANLGVQLWIAEGLLTERP